MIYKIQHASVGYGEELILDDVDFEIKNKNDKIAVVGRNGCGKTTLLKLISGEISSSSGDKGPLTEIIKTGNPEIGCLRQIAFEDEEITLDDEIRKVFKKILDMKSELDKLVILMSESESGHEELAHEYSELEEKFKDDGGYFYEKEYDTMLRNFGFSDEDKKKKISEFSGGQRTKLAFIKLLLSKPDILLLDEPTNHLDITAIEWLEGYIKNYKKAVVIVSHDRMFLDNTVDIVYEIEHAKLKRYVGNYTDFIATKKADYERELKAYNAQQKEIKRLEGVAQRFMAKPTKTSMARSKLKAIEHMDLIKAPGIYDNRTFNASFEPHVETGKDVLFAKDLSVGYDTVLATINLDIKRGQRLAVIGSNGIGKSTLLRTLAGKLPALGGEFKYGTNVNLGYFDQQMAGYTSKKQVIDDFWDEFPNLTETEVRNSLGAFLFMGDDVFKTVDMLSGGEKVRLALAKIFKKKPNVLLLDEPTNHMDIIGKETLESMLIDYKGTVIFVSHDRYFVKKVSDLILEMNGGSTRLWQFGYDDYVEKSGGESKDIPVSLKDNPKSEITQSVKSYQAGKEESRNRRKILKLETLIEELEKKGDELKEKLNDPQISSSYMKLSDLQKEIDKNDDELAKLLDEWEKLNEG